MADQLEPGNLPSIKNLILIPFRRSVQSFAVILEQYVRTTTNAAVAIAMTACACPELHADLLFATTAVFIKSDSTSSSSTSKKQETS